MCYYNGAKVAKDVRIRVGHVEKLVSNDELLSRQLLIGFDYGTAPVLKRIEGQEDFEIVPMEWGFLPSYLNDREAVQRFRSGYKKENGDWQQAIITLNAVSEELLLPRKIYRDAALHRRCLVLSSGFYEWRHIFPANKRNGKPVKTAVKIPYYICPADRAYWFMAGIWTPWKDRTTGEYVETFSIITTAANALMEQIHNSKKRMPTILTEELAQEWLFGDLDEARISEIARFQLPPAQMQAHTIAKDFREASDPTVRVSYDELVNQVTS